MRREAARDELGRGALVAHGGAGDDEGAVEHVGLHAAARPGPHEPAGAGPAQLLEADGGPGAADAVGDDGDLLAPVAAGERDVLAVAAERADVVEALR